MQFLDGSTLTPLTDTNGDGKPDTGALASGAGRLVVMRVTPAAGTPVGVVDNTHSAPSDGVTTQAPDGEQTLVSHSFQQPTSSQEFRQFWASTEAPVVLQRVAPDAHWSGGTHADASPDTNTVTRRRLVMESRRSAVRETRWGRRSRR